jgi:ribonuclease HI
MNEEVQDQSDIRIYSDGSGYEGNVGAGAVLYQRGVRKGKLRYRLGDLTEHTVYEGELVGLTLGAELLQKEARVKKVTFYTDNQATIQSLDSFKPGPGYYIADGFLHTITRIRHKFPRRKIRVHWIPGHEDVQGNKAVDETAKKATTDGSSHDAALPLQLRSRNTLPFSKSAFKQRFYAELNTENALIFAKSPRCNAIRRIDESGPTKN